MKHHDENEVARRLGAPAPPPPPELAARIKSEIPERLEVSPALTAPPGRPPLIGRLAARHRVLALAATVLVAVAAVMVARRVLLPEAGPPLEVALIESAPAPEEQAAAPATGVAQSSAPRPPPPAPAPAESDAEPPARAAAPAAARAETGKGRPKVPGDAAAPVPAQARQAAAPEPTPQAVAKAAAAAAEASGTRDAAEGAEGGAVGGVLGGVAGSTAASFDEAAIVHRIGGPVSAPELIHRVEPVYPEAALRARLQGVVVMEAVIDRDGAVRETRLLRNTTLSGECAEAALSAVRTWRYRPARLEGRPVAVYLTVAIAFRPE